MRVNRFISAISIYMELYGNVNQFFKSKFDRYNLRVLFIEFLSIFLRTSQLIKMKQQERG